MESPEFPLYVHLIPEGDNEPRESFKLTVQTSSTVDDLLKGVESHLCSRNVSPLNLRMGTKFTAI